MMSTFSFLPVCCARTQATDDIRSPCGDLQSSPLGELQVIVHLTPAVIVRLIVASAADRFSRPVIFSGAPRANSLS